MPPFEHFEDSRTGYRFGYGVQGSISTNTGLFWLGALGETVPSDTNQLRLNPSKKDSFGVPTVSIDFSWAPEDLITWKNMKAALAEMTEAFCHDTGIQFARPISSRMHERFVPNRLPPTPGSNHECGGARMGSDPASSTLDPYNRLWEAPNVLVCDAACFPSIPHQNPTATTMALAIRASRHLLAKCSLVAPLVASVGVV